MTWGAAHGSVDNINAGVGGKGGHMKLNCAKDFFQLKEFSEERRRASQSGAASRARPREDRKGLQHVGPGKESAAPSRNTE